VPRPCRHGGRPDQGPAPAVEVPAAPRPGLARRSERLDHAHERWLLGQQFDEPALAATDAHYRAVLAGRDAQLGAIETDLAGWYDRPPFAAQVARLAAYRGVTQLGALHLAAEVGDWRRFARASQFMGFCGLVPSAYSSGRPTWRGPLTRPGTRPCARSWSSRPGPTSTTRASAPRSPAASRAWTPGRRSCGAAQLRCAAGSAGWPPTRPPRNLVVAALARELAGFLWAEMTA
jgi:transposase